MTSLTQPERLRIGVDCGGTNTDAVILNLHPNADKENVVLASFKTPTTPDVTAGIQTAVTSVLGQVPASIASKIEAVSIGTTHFVNALVTRSTKDLDRVAVVRLCGPFSKRAKPFTGFPPELRNVLEGPQFFVRGGLQIDGSLINQVDEAEILSVCDRIKEQGIRSVAICSIFAPIDFDHRQEEQVEKILRERIPGIFVTVSKRIANVGLLARENATILNSSLLRFATKTVRGFQDAVEALGLRCPVFITSNDGCLMTLNQAAQLPITTFSSGPTNSMRGAAFLAGLTKDSPKSQTAIVMDIGGTTTELGVLLPSGFPRQAAAQHELCGVRLNFPMPHVVSIGLGGGSLISYDEDTQNATVGPDSVGYKLVTEAKVFGGEILTATDICVASGRASGFGNPLLVRDVGNALVDAASARMKHMLEITLDSVKTSSQDIPVYLAGGGAILCPVTLKGVSKVYRFPHYQCANAVGAAIALVSRMVDTVLATDSRSIAELQKGLEEDVISLVADAGGLPESVKVIGSEAIPVGYVAGRCRFIVKAAGDWGGKNKAEVNGYLKGPEIYQLEEQSSPENPKQSQTHHHIQERQWGLEDVLSYRPRVVDGLWTISELDVTFIAIGNYILGTGGGGDPEIARTALQDMLRNGARIVVKDIDSVDRNKLIGWGGMKGSPEAGSERLLGEEYYSATKALWSHLNIEPSAVGGVVANEIGGSNGLINMINGASPFLDIPVIDGDFMGRAFPAIWQTTVNVYGSDDVGTTLLPLCFASGDGVTMLMTSAKNHRECDSIPRAACVECGSWVGNAHRPLPAEFVAKAIVRNSVSLAWRIGRAVRLAQVQANLAGIGQVVVDAAGGSVTGKVLFEGKIVRVSRRTMRGHLHGELEVKALNPGDFDEHDEKREAFSGTVKIPFRNENILVKHVSTEGVETILAIVPDLVCVLDAGNGQALGTQDYKYGVQVIVIGLTAPPQWTSSRRGLDFGGPKAFGLDLPYTPMGRYIQPRSVIEEYNVGS